MPEAFETRLAGGHPNSLGNTVDVVATVLEDHGRLEELFLCYQSPDETVRLRTSSALKRINLAEPTWLHPYINRFLGEVAALSQASAQWTLAQLFLKLRPAMSSAQFDAAKAHLERNLAHHDDWIVLNTTMETLVHWGKDDADLAARIRPELERHATDKRKSVSGRARKYLSKYFSD